METEIFEFRMLAYRSGHSLLFIAATREETTVYWSFEGVEYLEGPMLWRGAAFKAESNDKCLEYLRRIRRFDKLPDAYLVSYFKLFVSGIVEEIEVKIVALSGDVSMDNPLVMFRDFS